MTDRQSRREQGERRWVDLRLAEKWKECHAAGLGQSEQGGESRGGQGWGLGPYRFLIHPLWT